MTSVLKLLVDALFVFSVVFIWLMLIYQFVLTLGGFALRNRTRRRPARPPDGSLPTVSIIVPARDEEQVIGALLDRIGAFDYPGRKVEVLVINDGSSDRTAEIVDGRAARDGRIKRVDVPTDRAGRGKGAALNVGLERAAGEVIAVYDADNLPEPDSLGQLCGALADAPRTAAVCGKFRAYNRRVNWLTRFINIESIAFQWIVQAGRWRLFRMAVIPGTNFVIRAAALREAGGWDEGALTEDSELSFRLYDLGYRVAFLPTAVTWEQEPQTLRVWFGQRKRWARGYYRLIADRFRLLFRKKPSLMSLELLNLLALYYVFVLAILVSDVLFLLSLCGAVHIRVLGPYAELWALAFLLFSLEILVALAMEGEDTALSLALIPAAYLVYTKLWVLVVIGGLYDEVVRRGDRAWVKTPRFPRQPDRSASSKEKEP